jgi:hypothetical protein
MKTQPQSKSARKLGILQWTGLALRRENLVAAIFGVDPAPVGSTT